MTAPIPAATLIIGRDTANGHEVLMVERNARLAFAGGAAVFPGGRVDRDDRLIAQGFDLDPDDAAARVAAIRESLEEAGIAVGIGGIDATMAVEWREALHKGAPFSDLLAGAGAALDLNALTPFARWLPDHHAPVRVFDTRFYLALAPGEATHSVDADGGETMRIFWVRPAEMLALADTGDAHVIYPTRRNLERLAAHADHAALLNHARSTPVTTIIPWIEERNGEDWLVVPEGLGYPVTAQRLADVRRG